MTATHSIPSTVLVAIDISKHRHEVLDTLVVHVPASVVQQTGDHAISVAPILVGQFDDVIGQTLFIGPALRHLALRRPVLAECAAGAALRHAKLPPHMVDALATTRRA